MPDTPSPIRPTDDDARALARDLLVAARFGALGVLSEGGLSEGGLSDTMPMVTRVAVGTSPTGPVILVSNLSAHTAALKADPRCSLMVGEPGPKGDPLTHPRLTLQARARPADKPALRAHWLKEHPKSALYIDFADFIFLRLEVLEAHLNGGFGKAYRLTAEDIGLVPPT